MTKVAGNVRKILITCGIKGAGAFSSVRQGACATLFNRLASVAGSVALVLSGSVAIAGPTRAQAPPTTVPDVTVRSTANAAGDGLMRRLVLGNCARSVWGTPLLGAEPVDLSDWRPIATTVATGGLRLGPNAVTAPDGSAMIDILPDNSSCFVQMQGDGARRDAGALQAEVLGHGSIVESRVFSVGLSDLMALTGLAQGGRVPVMSINRFQGIPPVTTAVFKFGSYEERPVER